MNNGWPDIGTLLLGPCEGTRMFIIKIFELDDHLLHGRRTSVGPTEQMLGPQVQTDTGKGTYPTLPFRFRRRTVPNQIDTMTMTSGELCSSSKVKNGPFYDGDSGGVVRSALSVARIGSDFDVVHLVIGLLLSSDTVLCGVMNATPRSIRDAYFGVDGQLFRTRLGGYLLGGVNCARLPGAVIVASERLCLREAYAGLGL